MQQRRFTLVGLVVAKGHPYSNKPAAKSCKFVKLCLSLCYHKRITTEKEGGSLPCHFSEIGKKCPNVWKKCPDCGHLWVKFLI